MFLVFFGHVIERVWDIGNEVAFPFFKIVYAFHMPFFFILSGIVAKSSDYKFFGFIVKLCRGRLIPVGFFTAILLPIHVLFFYFEQSYVMDFALQNPIMALGAFARGYPVFNLVVWFLISLFTVELIHFLVGRFVTTKSKLMVSIVITSLLGWVVTLRYDAIFSGVLRDFWFIRESIFMYSFFQIGLLLKHTSIVAEGKNSGREILIGIGCFLTLIASSLENSGPWFRMEDRPVVLINLSQHGDPLWFFLAALSGSLAMIMLAKATPPNTVLNYTGRNSLALMGLNGFFFHFINMPMAKWISLPESWVSVTLYGIIFSVITMFLSLILIRTYDEFFPKSSDTKA